MASLGLAKYWKVVGGGDKGGVVVREGKELTSTQCLARLSTGAVVFELEVENGRLHFERQTGQGPERGWVSLRLKDQELMIEAQGPGQVAPPGDMLSLHQCQQAQRMLQHVASKSEVQQQLNVFEAACGGDQRKYESKLKGFLFTQIYPILAKHFGFAVPVEAPAVIFKSLSAYCMESIEMAEKWLKLEQTLRNADAVRQAEELVEQVRQKQDGPAELIDAATSSEDEVDFDAQCIMSIQGEVIGIVDLGRVLGGCPAAGCKMYRPPKSGPRICRRCGRQNIEHEDQGPFVVDDESDVDDEQASAERGWNAELKQDAEITVRINVQKPQATSNQDVMHLKMSSKTTVAELRKMLQGFLPPRAPVLSATLQPLLDDSIVPESVFVSEVTTAIKPKDVLTPDQVKVAQHMMMKKWREPDMQAQLDELEITTAGNQRKYASQASQIALREVYPDICDCFGIRHDRSVDVGLAIQHHAQADIEIVENWLKLETLMRNQEKIKQARQWLQSARGNALPREPSRALVSSATPKSEASAPPKAASSMSPKKNAPEFSLLPASKAILTLEQVKEAQQMMMNKWRQTDMQAKLDELERTTGGNERRYTMQVTQIVLHQVFPDICDHFGLAREKSVDIGLSIQYYSPADPEIVENWLELETLMRNQEKIKQAQQLLELARTNMASMGA